MGTEVITYSRIGKEDIRFGKGTFEVVLADGRKAIINEVDVGAIANDTSLSSIITTLMLASYTKAGLPTAGTAGRLARVTDDPNQGVYLDTGTSWELVGPADSTFVWDSTNKRLGIRTTSPARTLDITQSAAGVPQIRLTGSTQGYADIRCGGSGLDDGDLFLQPTGSTYWLQSLTTNYPATLELVPNGTVATNSANLELYGTDYVVDSTNYERLRVSAEGSAGAVHEIISEQGGTGTIRPIHIYLSGLANGIYLQNATTNGIGTMTPRVKWDILSSANVQLRLSYSDNVMYADCSVDSNGNLTIAPVGHTTTSKPFIYTDSNNQVLHAFGDVT